jgi:hypothetical protein
MVDGLLIRVRAVVDSGDREGALALLVELLKGGGRTAQSVPEVVANALVATARTKGERDDADRAALAEYRGAALARDEIVALILQTPLVTDDLVAVQQALDERLARDHATRQAAAPHVLEAARRQTELAFAGREGRVLAAKLGRGYLELKYIPSRSTGKVHGPYLYQRWVEAGRRRSRYIGKPA